MQIIKRSFLILLSVMILINTSSVITMALTPESVHASDGSLVSQNAINGWKTYKPNAADISVNLSSATVNGQPLAQVPVNLEKNDTITFSAQIAAAGDYRFLVEYCVENAINTEMQMTFAVDDRSFLGSLPILWTNVSNDYETDRSGNEIVPEQKAVDNYISDIADDYRAVNRGDLNVSLTAGIHSFSITSLSQSINIKSITLLCPQQIQTYQEYLSEHKTGKTANELITVEGEDFAVKSESFIRGKATKNSFLLPYTSGKERINILDGATWSSPGQKVLWEVTAPKDGYYEMAVHYTQYSDANKQSYRTVEVDGETPFKEFSSICFPATQSGEYKNYTLSDSQGSAYEIYLTAGVHTISMDVTMGDFEDVYNDLVAAMNTINGIGMDLQKLSAGSTDANRTWDMDTVLPGALSKLEEVADKIDGIYEKLKQATGEKPTYADSLIYAADSLRNLLKNPRVLPNKTELLNIGDNSVSKFLGSVLSKLTTAPLTIDCIYLSSGEAVPTRTSSLWKRFLESVQAFFASFTGSYSSYDADISKKNNKELSVWVNHSIQYTETMQRLLDQNYNKDNNTNIKLSIMPSEQKLILANASGTNPDIALGVGCSTPFDFAIRNAAKNLLDYNDFLSFYQTQFNTEALTPMSYNDGIYGMPETLDFQVLFYRKDILKSLGLSVPDTWDDVKYMMPTLLRYHMNFYISLSASSGYKSFATTSPFLFQNNAALFKDDGSAVAFNSDAGMKSFREMIDLYSVYGMQQAVPSFYNSFRYGEIPIGIGNMSLYLQLTAAAPELSGLWGIAPAPGTVCDGKITRYQTADVTANMIFKNTKQPDEAWNFLKWWMGKNTQVEYAHAMKSTYGPEYFWCTANLNAFAELSMSEADKSIVLQQWKWQKEVVRHPSNYMVEREVSNIWNNVVVNGMELSDAVDNAVITSNREITRKLEEFGYCDGNGNLLKPYVTDPVAKIRKSQETGGEDQ